MYVTLNSSKSNDMSWNTKMLRSWELASFSDVGIRLVENPNAMPWKWVSHKFGGRFIPGESGLPTAFVAFATMEVDWSTCPWAGGRTQGWGKQITRKLDWWLSTLEWLARMDSPCSSRLRLRWLSNLSGSLAAPPHRAAKSSIQGKLRPANHSWAIPPWPTFLN